MRTSAKRLLPTNDLQPAGRAAKALIMTRASTNETSSEQPIVWEWDLILESWHHHSKWDDGEKFRGAYISLHAIFLYCSLLETSSVEKI